MIFPLNKPSKLKMIPTSPKETTNVSMRTTIPPKKDTSGVEYCNIKSQAKKLAILIKIGLHNKAKNRIIKSVPNNLFMTFRL